MTATIAEEARPVERGHEVLAGGRVVVCWSTTCGHRDNSRPARRRPLAFPALTMLESKAARS